MGESREDPYLILGVARGATPAQVQEAYKGLVKKYHPDRVASLGEEFRVIAERRMKLINWAYDQLRVQV